MDTDERFHSWKQYRREASVPHAFADRVMAAVCACEPPCGQPSLPRRLLLVLCSARLARAAVLGLGCLACLFRMLQVLAIFVPE